MSDEALEEYDRKLRHVTRRVRDLEHAHDVEASPALDVLPSIGVNKKSTSDSWCSPRSITVPLYDFFGGPVGVDPCSNERSIVKAHLTYTRNGLFLPWKRPDRDQDTVYDNDPYSKAADWTVKMCAELRTNVSELVRLSMASTSTAWWRQGALEPKRNPRIIFCRRLKFIDPDAPQDNTERMTSRFEPALWYYGPRVKAFERAYRHVTSWLSWGR